MLTRTDIREIDLGTANALEKLASGGVMVAELKNKLMELCLSIDQNDRKSLEEYINWSKNIGEF